MDVRHAVSPVTVVLTRRDLATLMKPRDYLGAVEDAFRATRQGRAHAPPPLHLAVGDRAGFHARCASYRADRAYVALKFNGNFPDNPARTGLPTIQGAVLLCDGSNGSVLAIMDSIELTLRRTAAATALAAHYLARADSTTLAICGCGAQAPAQLAALADVYALKRVRAWDLDTVRVAAFARDASAACDVSVVPCTTLEQAVAGADIVVTCTTSTDPFLDDGHVAPGTFVAAVGADVLEQCAQTGDLHHAIHAGMLRAEDVHAELADLVTGTRPGRTSPDQVWLFDSTGTALEDVASAATAYRRAMACAAGIRVALGANP